MRPRLCRRRSPLPPLAQPHWPFLASRPLPAAPVPLTFLHILERTSAPISDTFVTPRAVLRARGLPVSWASGRVEPTARLGHFAWSSRFGDPSPPHRDEARTISGLTR